MPELPDLPNVNMQSLVTSKTTWDSFDWVVSLVCRMDAFICSMLANKGSGFMTMPPPPPKG